MFETKESAKRILMQMAKLAARGGIEQQPDVAATAYALLGQHVLYGLILDSHKDVRQRIAALVKNKKTETLLKLLLEAMAVYTDKGPSLPLVIQVALLIGDPDLTWNICRILRKTDIGDNVHTLLCLAAEVPMQIRIEDLNDPAGAAKAGRPDLLEIMYQSSTDTLKKLWIAMFAYCIAPAE